MTKIVIHHTGNATDSTPEQLDAYHKGLGWPGIGYHLCVRQEGRVYYCGDLSTIRYHAGEHNPTTVGIVLTGNFTKYYPLPSQLAGASRAIAYAKQLIGHPVEVLGHRELPGQATQCPGLSFDGWRELL